MWIHLSQLQIQYNEGGVCWIIFNGSSDYFLNNLWGYVISLSKAYNADDVSYIAAYYDIISSNQIHTIINGHRVTIRFYIYDGDIRSINAFMGWASKIIGKLIRE